MVNGAWRAGMQAGVECESQNRLLPTDFVGKPLDRQLKRDAALMDLGSV